MTSVIITGSRHFTDKDRIRQALSNHEQEMDQQITTLFHGGCRGADQTAAVVAREFPQIETVVYPANWTKHGRAAGPIRNKRMLEDNKDATVIAFLAEDSKGTKNCIEQARQLDMNIVVYHC